MSLIQQNFNYSSTIKVWFGIELGDNLLKTINYLIHFEYVLYVYDNMNVIF